MPSFFSWSYLYPLWSNFFISRSPHSPTARPFQNKWPHVESNTFSFLENPFIASIFFLGYRCKLHWETGHCYSDPWLETFGISFSFSLNVLFWKISYQNKVGRVQLNNKYTLLVESRIVNILHIFIIDRSLYKFYCCWIFWKFNGILDPFWE